VSVAADTVEAGNVVRKLNDLKDPEDPVKYCRHPLGPAFDTSSCPMRYWVATIVQERVKVVPAMVNIAVMHAEPSESRIMCWPVLVPQIIGDGVADGDVIPNASVTHCPALSLLVRTIDPPPGAVPGTLVVRAG